MPIDIPPNLANTVSSAIVRQAEQAKINNMRKQEEERIKNAGRDAANANNARKNGK